VEKKDVKKSNHKILVVYYSKTGHTRKIAQDIAKQIDADLEEITDQKKRTGLLGFILGGRDALTGKKTKISEIRKNPAEYGLVILGGPIWAGSITPAVRTYINQYKDSLPPVASFFSSGGKTPDQVFEKLSNLLPEKLVSIMGLSQEELKDTQNYHARLSSFLKKTGEFLGKK